MKTKPMTMLVAMMAGWLNRQQQEAMHNITLLYYITYQLIHGNSLNTKLTVKKM